MTRVPAAKLPDADGMRMARRPSSTMSTFGRAVSTVMSSTGSAHALPSTTRGPVEVLDSPSAYGSASSASVQVEMPFESDHGPADSRPRRLACSGAYSTSTVLPR